MSMLRALALLGAGVGGYDAGVEEKRRRDRQDEDAAFQREQRARQRTDWQRQDKDYEERQSDQDAMRQQMAPVSASPVYPTGDDEGNTMPMTPDMQRYTVPGQAGTLTQAAANTAVAAANDPSARMQRAAAAVRNPILAAKLSQDAITAKTGAIQLQEAEAAQQARVWDRKMGDALIGSPGKLTDPSSITEFMSNSQADGMDGQSKWAHKIDAKDNKLTIYPIGPDGTALNNGFTIDNTLEGRVRLAAMLSKATPITAKLADMRAEEKLRTDREDKMADNKRLDKVADADAEYKKALAAAAGVRADAAMTKATGGGAPTRADHFDEKQWDAVRKVDQALVSFDDGMGGKPVESPELRTVFLGQLNRLQAQGTMSPNEAAEAARTTTLKLRDAASAMVEQAKAADPKSKLTEAQAVKALLKQFQQAQAAPAAAAPAVAPVAAPSAMPAATAAPAGRPAMVAAVARPPTTQDAALNRIEAGTRAQIAQMNEAVVQARAQLAAAAKSNDPTAANLYAQKLQQLVSARDKLAEEKLGNGAPAFLATLPQ